NLLYFYFGYGPLPSNIISNPKGKLKAITTRSYVSYEGPLIPPSFSSLPKVVERVPEVTKDTMQPSTKNIQPLKLHFKLSFADALFHMPKFAIIFKSLLSNKEKLFDLVTTLVNDNCSAVILKKLPKKLGDPGKFLIPCNFLELVECLALDDLGASINLMPPLIWEKLSLPELTPTQMILELADRSTTRPSALPKTILPFLRTIRALIDVYGEELTLRVDDEAITFKGGDFILEEIEACLASKSIPPGIDDTDFDPEEDILLLEKLLNDDPSSPLFPKELNLEEIKTVKSFIDDPPELKLKDLPSHLEVNLKIHEVIKKEVIKLLDAGLIYPISGSPWVSPVHCVPKKGGMTVVTNEDDELILNRYFQILIDPQDQEKTTFTCPYGTFAYRRMPFGLCNAPGTFQRCMMAIFHDMIEETMEVFMNDFLVFGDSFSSCLCHLDKRLKRCEDTKLVLNWEKCHFMVKEDIVFGHKISKTGIEVDRAKVDVIA
nr:reverse transcriptase domain-containing protein [Tanacetum cinerariifolium]